MDGLTFLAYAKHDQHHTHAVMMTMTMTIFTDMNFSPLHAQNPEAEMQS